LVIKSALVGLPLTPKASPIIAQGRRAAAHPGSRNTTIAATLKGLPKISRLIGYR
jgi:hypothetical protein